jgi:rubrerythrin
MKKYIVPAFILALACAVAIGCAGKDDPKTATIKNLKSAITGETTASDKYAAFSKKAKDEGFAEISVLFAAASKAEGFHAAKHKTILEKMGAKMDAVTPKFEVKSTKENLEASLKGETEEVDSMYPGFIKTAQEGKFKDAEMTFNAAFQVEKIHQGFFKAAIEALAKKDFKGMSATYAVCPVCGNTFGKDVPAVCPICGEVKANYVAIK